MSDAGHFLDTSRIVSQQERKVARIDLLIAQQLEFEQLDEEFALQHAFDTGEGLHGADLAEKIEQEKKFAPELVSYQN